MLVSAADLEKINRECEWNDEAMEHKIPFFYLRDKAVMFPKTNNNKEYVENEKNKK